MASAAARRQERARPPRRRPGRAAAGARTRRRRAARRRRARRRRARRGAACPRHGIAAVEELDPREVVEVAVLAGHSSGPGTRSAAVARGSSGSPRARRWCARAARGPTRSSKRPCSIGASRLHSGQRSQRGNGATGTPALSPSGHDRRREQLLDLRAAAGPHGGEQPWLRDRLAQRLGPVVEAEHQRRHLGQLDGRADAVGVQQLARAQLADVLARPHSSAPSARGRRGSLGGLPSVRRGRAMPSVRSASGTAVSTLRIEVGTVQSPQPSSAGLLQQRRRRRRSCRGAGRRGCAGRPPPPAFQRSSRTFDAARPARRRPAGRSGRRRARGSPRALAARPRVGGVDLPGARGSRSSPGPRAAAATRARPVSPRSSARGANGVTDSASTWR